MRVSGWQPRVWLHLLIALLQPNYVRCEPCPGRLDCNVVQLTEEVCDFCFGLEEFIRDHKYVYVLFYLPRGNLNQDLLAKFEATAKEWKWSRVAFGKLDTSRDRRSAEKWMQPHMVPTNVIFKAGEGVQVAMKDLEILKRKYEAKPPGQRWWLTKYMGDDAEGTNLHYAAPLGTVKSLRRFAKRNPLAIVGFFEQASGQSWDAFHEFVWHAHQVATSSSEPLLSWRVGSTNAAFAVLSNKQLAPKELASTLPRVAVYRQGVLTDHFSVPKRRFDVLTTLAQSVPRTIASSAEVKSQEL